MKFSVYIRIFLLLTAFLIWPVVVDAAYYVSDPSLCPTDAYSQSCVGGLKVCGVSSTNVVSCYDTASFNPPSSTANVYSGTITTTGGYMLDCYGYDSSVPRCDNSGNFVCQQSTSCNSLAKVTICTANEWAESTCGDCKSGYHDCNTNGSCNDTGEHDGAACTTSGGLPGSYSNCVCVGSILKLGSDSVASSNAGTNVSQAGSSAALFVNGTNVGIGTSTPSTFFSVTGTTGEIINVNGGRIMGLNDVPVNDDEAVSLKYLLDNYTSTATSTLNSLWSGTKDGNIWNGTSGTGNVGIGTTNLTTAKVTILGGGSNTYLTELNSYSNGSYGIRTNGPAKANSYYLYSGTGGFYTYSGVPMFYTDAGSHFSMGSNAPISTSRFTIKSLGNTSATSVLDLINSDSLNLFTVLDNGRVGIGTTNPGAKLDVNGDSMIWSNEVKKQVAYKVGVFANSKHEVRIPWPSTVSGPMILDVEVLIDTGSVGTRHYVKKRFYLASFATMVAGSMYSQSSYVVESIDGSATVYNYIGEFENDTTSGEIVLPIYSGPSNTRTNSIKLTAWGTKGLSDLIVNATHTANVETEITPPARASVQAPIWDDFIISQNLGIGTTAPVNKLSVSGGTGNVLNVNGGKIVGLDYVPANRDDAVPLSYLEDNYSQSGDSLWSGTKDGNIWNGTSGTGNVGIGITAPTEALDVIGKISLNDGGDSVFVGEGAGLSDDGVSNYGVGIGYQALKLNTSGRFNAAVGYRSMVRNTTGNSNTAIGYNSLEFNISGSNNLAIGFYALGANSGGHGNFAMGSTAGRYIADGVTENTEGDYNMFLGANTKALTATDENEIVIGYNAIGLGSNSVVLGNDDITKTALKGNVGIGTTAPTEALHIKTTDNTALRLEGGNSGKTSSFIFGEPSRDWAILRQNYNKYGNSAYDMEISYIGTAYGGNLLLRPTGNVGIGTTTATTTLFIDGGANNVLNVNGGRIMGLNDTPVNDDEAVPFGYLEDNYAAISSTDTAITSVFLTDSFYDGSFTFSDGSTGYDAGNQICNAVDAGSHFCRTDEVMYLIQKNRSNSFSAMIAADTVNANGWIADGPPGYTGAVAADDCNGWKDNTSSKLGHFWLFDTDGGGSGALINCTTQKRITCCK